MKGIGVGLGARRDARCLAIPDKKPRLLDTAAGLLAEKPRRKAAFSHAGRRHDISRGQNLNRSALAARGREKGREQQTNGKKEERSGEGKKRCFHAAHKRAASGRAVGSRSRRHSGSGERKTAALLSPEWRQARRWLMKARASFWMLFRCSSSRKLSV